MTFVVFSALSVRAEDDLNWTIVRDFMTQNICVDDAGRPVVGVSPLRRAECITHRDHRPGELLTYHKHDYANAASRASLPAGYQRSDSVAVRSEKLGVVVVQTFDFGSQGRRFGQYDAGRGDGGQFVIFSRGSVAIGGTEDAGGPKLFVGTGCAGRPDPAAAVDSWILVDATFRPGASWLGHTVARLRLHADPTTCPQTYDLALTRWYLGSYRFRADFGRSRTHPMSVLVSEHFGGASIARADHLERFYFTRELGWTRWERWEQLGRTRLADVQARAARLERSRRCDDLAPAPARSWRMVDCREWTNIVAPDNPAGDAPDFWLAQLSESMLIAPVLGRLE